MNQDTNGDVSQNLEGLRVNDSEGQSPGGDGNKEGVCPVRASEASAGQTNGTTHAKRSQKHSKRKQKVKIPSLRIFCGTFVHPTASDPLVVLERWMLGVDGGKIVFSDTLDRYWDVINQYNAHDVHKEISVYMDDGMFMLPGFVDAHTSAVPFLATGLQDQATEGSTYMRRRREKTRLVSDDKIAKRLFSKVRNVGMAHGTTCIAYNGTHVESAARLLADVCSRGKQRVFLGLDISLPDSKEVVHMFQITKAHDVINHIQRIPSERVRPHIVLSSPLAVWLETKVAELHSITGIPVKLCVGQRPSSGESGPVQEWIRPFHNSVLGYHAGHGMLTEQTVLAGCRHCSDMDLQHIVDAGAGVVYCPADDLHHGDLTDVDRLLNSQVKLGLGTDLEHGDSLSMLSVIRQCLQVQQLRARLPTSETTETLNGITDVTNGKIDDGVNPVDLPESVYPWHEVDRRANLKDFFKMATLGGASVVGLEKEIGNFEVGKWFDAILVNPCVSNSTFIVLPGKDTIEESVEKFICAGDDRNIARVYIAGERVK